MTPGATSSLRGNSAGQTHKMISCFLFGKPHCSKIKCNNNSNERAAQTTLRDSMESPCQTRVNSDLWNGWTTKDCSVAAESEPQLETETHVPRLKSQNGKIHIMACARFQGCTHLSRWPVASIVLNNLITCFSGFLHSIHLRVMAQDPHIRASVVHPSRKDMFFFLIYFFINEIGSSIPVFRFCMHAWAMCVRMKPILKNTSISGPCHHR